MLKLNKFSPRELKVNSLNRIRGGSTKTGSGTKNYTNSQGQSCSFNYTSDCITQTSNGGSITKYCGKSNQNCE